jgi:hypothetical protein
MFSTCNEHHPAAWHRLLAAYPDIPLIIQDMQARSYREVVGDSIIGKPPIVTEGKYENE